MYRLALTVLALALTVSFVTSSQARGKRGEKPEDWARLFVEERSRIDVIDIEPRMGRFDKVRIVAINDDIYVESVRLKLARRSSKDVKIGRVIKKGTSTVVIDLPGDSEIVQSAEVRYKVRIPSKGYVILEGLVSAEPGGYEVLQTKVLGTKDDVVTLRVEQAEGFVTSIRLRAWVQPVRIRGAEIVYGNGDRQKIRIRDRLDPGRATDPIDLAGRERRVKSLTLRLRPQRGQAERARIDLLGKVGPANYDRRKRRGKDRRSGRDWRLLGTNKAAIFSKDNDSFSVGPSEGAFKTIRVRARGEDVRMYGMQIRYGNGKVESVPLYGTLGAGQISQAFDLKGRHRYIDSVKFKYRTKLNFKGQAEVELWGK